MKEFLENAARLVVAYPNDIKINEIIGNQTIIFEVRVNPLDRGQIIGKNGKIIKSLRSILIAAAAKRNTKVLIEIIEE